MCSIYIGIFPPIGACQVIWACDILVAFEGHINGTNFGVV